MIRIRVRGAVLAGVVAVAASGGCGSSGGASFYGLSGLGPCLTKAGARRATAPGQLDFARGAQAGLNVEVDAVGALRDGSVTGSYMESEPTQGGWHVYYGVPKGRKGPALADLIRDPRSATVTAYVRPADAATVRKADDCLDGDEGD